MIEVRIQPGIGSVAEVAACRESAGNMTGVGGRSEIRRVAGITLGRHRLKLAAGSPFVAGVAVHGGVGSGEGKAIIVLLDLLHADLPSLYRVALLAIGSQLPAVNIGVAILTALPDVAEHRLDVALHASDRLVHATQWISRLVVIEFGNCADRLPGARGVTVLARNIQVSVRAVRTGRLLRPSGNAECQQEKKYRQLEHAPTRPHDRPLAPCLVATTT